MSGLRGLGSHRPPWRTVLSVLAGGGLTAATLGGPFAGGALGAEAPTGSTTTGENAQPPPTTTTTPAPGTSTTSTGSSTTSTSTTPSTTTSSTSSSPPPTSAPPASTPATAPTTGESPTVVIRRKQQPTPSKPAGSNVTQTKANPSGGSSAGSANNANGAPGAPGAGTAAGGAGNVALPPQLVAGQAGALAAMLSGSAVSAQALNFYRIPLFLLPIYRAAAIQYDVPWPILAAINEIETDYGTDLSVSSAGAEGWMQFEPSTWLQYGVDALNAGYADPYNPVDAIFAAARYLNAAGAAHNLNAAILAYNHSEAYVSSVLLRAKLIAAYPDQVIATLTGLIDGRPPVTGKHIGWGAVTSAAPAGTGAATAATGPLPPSSSATAGAVAGSDGSAGSASAATAAQGAAAGAAGTPGSSVAPAPASAATTATSTSTAAPQLVDVTSEPSANAVAVQDGRILKLGYSRKLGRYVVLQDVYGDVFTYAGLGSIAHSYELPRSESAARPSQGPGTSTQRDASTSAQAATGPAGGARASESTPTGTGKVRVFAHPYGNPDALAAVAHAKAAGASVASGRQPLRSGSIVTENTVLGRVSTPPGAKDGHLRFAIRPAGDSNTIDPRAILANWTELDAALHPQGAKGNPSLLGATASDVFLLPKSRLEREVLSDPGIALSACSRHEVASGAIDKRALAVLAFLSRSGLKPTVGTLRCGGGAFAVSGYASPGHAGDAVAIVAINGIPIAGHQGAGSITDTTIRTLLTLQNEFVPARIVSLMRYPGAPTTLARADHGDYIEIVFAPAPAHARPVSSAATAAHAAAAGKSAPAPMAIVGELSPSQWEQLIGRIAALPAPAVPVKPSSAAIPDHGSSRGSG